MFLIFFKFMSKQAEYQMCHLFVCQTPFPVAGSAGGSQRPLWSLKSLQTVHRALLENVVGYFLPAEEAIAHLPRMAWRDEEKGGLWYFSHLTISSSFSKVSVDGQNLCLCRPDWVSGEPGALNSLLRKTPGDKTLRNTHTFGSRGHYKKTNLQTFPWSISSSLNPTVKKLKNTFGACDEMLISPKFSRLTICKERLEKYDSKSTSCTIPSSIRLCTHTHTHTHTIISVVFTCCWY